MKTKKVVGIFSFDPEGNGRIDIIPNPGKDILGLKDQEEIKISTPRLCNAEPL